MQFNSRSALIQHINNQQEHHRKKTFTEEYIEMLKEFEIEYDQRFIFKPVDVNYTVPDVNH